ncbi:MAG: glycosyltransferase family 2 protein [Lachnospiraceae bacterium]|nr:glycosyltransferase family 2 protein [Lachnospiraceae bacterium]
MANDVIVIVIPVYNPDEVFSKFVQQLINVGFTKIVVVNDGSDKNIKEIGKVEKYNEVEMIHHVVNRGKGRALKTAFDYVLIHHSDCQGVITTDADGQHTIKDIQKCAHSLQTCYTDKKMILGCREFQKNRTVPFRSKFGNLFTCFVLRVFSGLRISDSQTGLRGIPMNALSELLVVEGERYEYEMNVLFAWNQIGQFYEVPIDTIYEDNNSSSHFHPLRDSLRIYKIIFQNIFK